MVMTAKERREVRRILIERYQKNPLNRRFVRSGRIHTCIIYFSIPRALIQVSRDPEIRW